jgi:hypothetical protein
MRILIRVSGDIRRPLLDADSIEAEGGRITAVGKAEAHPPWRGGPSCRNPCHHRPPSDPGNWSKVRPARG